MTTCDHEGRAISTTKYDDGTVKIEIFQKISEHHDMSQGAIHLYSDEKMQMAYRLIEAEIGIDAEDIKEKLHDSIVKLKELRKRMDAEFSDDESLINCMEASQ